MDVIYKLDHKFDRLQDPRGKRFALRLYLDMVVHEMVGNGPGETTRFFHSILINRFGGGGGRIGNVGGDDDVEGGGGGGGGMCDADDIVAEGNVPVAQHVYGDCTQDSRLVARHFARIKPAEVRDILFIEYVEEMAAEVVGVNKMAQFFHDCFQGQDYELTHADTSEHEKLWRYYDEEDEGPLD
jgi:hypothetical protein